jgi:hypothetical protein
MSRVERVGAQGTCQALPNAESGAAKSVIAAWAHFRANSRHQAIAS